MSKFKYRQRRNLLRELFAFTNERKRGSEKKQSNREKSRLTSTQSSDTKLVLKIYICVPIILPDEMGTWKLPLCVCEERAHIMLHEENHITNMTMLFGMIF